MPETNRIEYKQRLTDDLEKEIIAFLNYPEGGLLYLGVDKDGHAVGISDTDALQLKIKDRLKHNIQPSCLGLFDLVSEERNGKEIIKIIVASGPEKPYHLRKYGMSEKGAFIRTGSAAEPMPAKMIEKLFARRTRHSLGRIQSNRQDLKFEQLKIYYEESGMMLNKQFATNLGLRTPDQLYNYVAYLMADENAVSIKVAKYSGTNRVDLVENNEYGYCSLIKATHRVLDKIDLENRTSSRITPKKREDTRLWNPIALREAIINAVVHNDYSREVPPKFELFADRIEITSAGGLPEDLSKEEFFQGFSVPRNQEIMRIFKDLDMVEYLGSGVPRILEHYERSCFHFSDNFLRMVFPATETVTSQSTEEGNINEQFRNVQAEFGSVAKRLAYNKDENITFLRDNYGVFTGYLRGIYGVNLDEIKNKFGERMLFVLALVAIDPDITRQQIANIIGVSLSTIEKSINNLRKEKILSREGADKTGYWKIIKRN